MVPRLGVDDGNLVGAEDPVEDRPRYEGTGAMHEQAMDLGEHQVARDQPPAFADLAAQSSLRAAMVPVARTEKGDPFATVYEDVSHDEAFAKASRPARLRDTYRPAR